LNKLEKGPIRDYETVFCSLLAIMVLEKILKNLAFFQFSTSCMENIQNSGIQGTKFRKANPRHIPAKNLHLGVIVSEIF
jgi:hypothetical protein